jgi:hypothetical protein
MMVMLKSTEFVNHVPTIVLLVKKPLTNVLNVKELD